ncbi:MAG: hypothetical protein MJ059_05230 [Lachnospiraceae bacterium]|nr:hypothetical protein [Lachnospiraceae bacterium]
MEELHRLQLEVWGIKAENDFLKNGGVLCEGEPVSSCHFIDRYKKRFGTAWLLRRMNVCPNAYYNYRKHRKNASKTRKAFILKTISEIYHASGGRGPKWLPFTNFVV